MNITADHLEVIQIICRVTADGEPVGRPPKRGQEEW
jgi:hypothetical protein